MRTRFAGGTIVLADTIIQDGAITIEDGMIAAIGEDGHRGEVEIDLGGCMLLPGIVDLHGDAIEKEVEPRPNALFPLSVALASIDRRCIACGITTAFHALSFADGEFGVRDSSVTEKVARALADRAPHALADNRVHVRYEITDPMSEPAVARLLEDGTAGLLSFMDHTPGQGQFKDIASYKAYFGTVYAVSDGELDTMIRTKEAGAATALARMERLAALAGARGVATAGHDDEGAERIALMTRLGAGISEFPCDLETARAAHAAGLATIFGAPNVVRGRSLSGALSAREAIADGVANCLCSDYAPQAMLPAVAAITTDLGYSLPDAVRLVTLEPAQAAGLDDRGEIAVGKRADLIVAGEAGGCLSARSVWREGREVFSTGPLRAAGHG